MTTDFSDHSVKPTGSPPDSLFTGLELNDATAAEVVRCTCELIIFENSLKGTKPKLANALDTVLKLPAQTLSVNLVILVNKEWSMHFTRIQSVKKTDLEFLHPTDPKSPDSVRDISQVFLPIKAFSLETQRRIFLFLAQPIREDIQLLQDRRHNLVFPDKQIKKRCDILSKLAEQLSARNYLTKTDRIISLKAHLVEDQSHCKELKEQLQFAAPSANTKRLENKLNQAHKSAASIASELQKLLTTDQPIT